MFLQTLEMQAFGNPPDEIMNEMANAKGMTLGANGTYFPTQIPPTACPYKTDTFFYSSQGCRICGGAPWVVVTQETVTARRVWGGWV